MKALFQPNLFQPALFKPGLFRGIGVTPIAPPVLPSQSVSGESLDDDLAGGDEVERRYRPRVRPLQRPDRFALHRKHDIESIIAWLLMED